MLKAIQNFFSRHADPSRPEGPEETGESRRDPLPIAACALLLELAHADDEFSEDERRHIQGALMRHFDIEAETARELMVLADQERREAVDLYQFASLIARSYDEGQRMVLAEVMWRVVYADGELSKHESYLIRRISNLLDLRPGFLAEARKRARGKPPA